MIDKAINRVFLQKSNAKSEERRFEIYNNKFMRVTIHSLLGEKHYHLNLTMMEPWPVRQWQLSWRWLSTVAGFGLATFIFGLYIYYIQHTESLGITIPIFAALILFTLGSFLVFLYRSPNVVEFRSRYGGCVLISLLHNTPNKKEVDNFAEELKNRILAATQSVNIDQHQMLAIELKELRRLATESILSDMDYVKAKNRIFKMH